MSFILDALKKSESDRQRQKGPALFEVKVAPPRRILPPWAIAIGVLLAVNLMIVAWMVLRHPRAEAAVSVTPPPLVATGQAGAPVPGAPAQQPPAPLVVAPPAATAQQVPPLAVPASAPYPAGPAAAGGAGGEPNPEDYAPAQEPAPMKGSHVQRGTVEGVPLYQDATAAPGAHIPPLRLDLHVYADRPQDRFVMINMHKLREGDALPEGVRVESITADGAVLSYNGSRFLLTQ
ncbi:MAG TPA: general secretion pathway protein GspB [Steroidobacteraceae bacterium]|jgi:general secretion pathway protein B|nr:general secretion pathway protein GspB [Steroidobacteraceae bacterium]